jgi:hypothetical protein
MLCYVMLCYVIVFVNSKVRVTGKRRYMYGLHQTKASENKTEQCP